MRQLTFILSIVLMMGLITIPVMAWGPHGSWRGHHMMGYWGGDTASTNVTTEQRAKLDSLEQKFLADTKDLRSQLWTKSSDLGAVLSSTDPDIKKAKTLRSEITTLRAKLDEKRFDYDLAVRNVLPEGERYYSSRRGPYTHGMGYGMMGYGPGACWNED